MLTRDFDENKVYNEIPELLDILLFDYTTKSNILWATNNYRRKGPGYYEKDIIKSTLLIGAHGRIIKPRVEKSKTEQTKRSRNNAEVFTPSWICNKQNNMIDDEWFGYKNSFNYEKDYSWIPTERVIFLNKNWKEYINEIRMEITCGEAPYITSRYDAVTGEMIDIKSRIGLLDRKLRVVNENAVDDSEWLFYTIKSFQSVYGYEFQGDNLLIARENILMTFIDHFEYKYNRYPDKDLLLEIAKIISWNFWQMDGLKMVVPYSCHEEEVYQLSLFDDVKPNFCKGCRNGNIKDHNGKRCYIMDWDKNKKVKFLELMR